MSILLKWKNKLQDPPSSSSCENKIREFDERVSLLKNENVELHKRIDQLEALCTTSVDSHQTRFLEEHIRQLEQENGRLCTENHCQRQEYEQFLDQLTTMILRTAVMQEMNMVSRPLTDTSTRETPMNIRKECASIYHVIERLSTLTTNAIQDKRLEQIAHRATRFRSLSWENLDLPHELVASSQIVSKSPKTTAEFIRQLCQNQSSLSSSSSLSSCSSTTTHCSLSTSGSWTLDLSFYAKDSSAILPIAVDRKTNDSLLASPSAEKKEEEEAAALQRSDTFVIGKITPAEVVTSSLASEKPTTTMPDRHVNSNVQRCSTTRTMAATTPAVVRPSRLPSRCSTTRTTNSVSSSHTKTPPSSSNNTNRSLSVKKASKLPVRTASSVSKPATSTKKSSLPTAAPAKTKKDATVTLARSVSSSNPPLLKKTVRPPIHANTSTTPTSSSKARARSTTAPSHGQSNTHASLPLSKRNRTNPPVVNKLLSESTIVAPKQQAVKSLEEKSDFPSEQMNSTSSESSLEENQQQKKLLTVVQDEGYSTWSSSDVKDELSMKNSSRTATDERRRSSGLVKNWLDTSNKSSSRKPVNEVEAAKLEEFSRELTDNASMICPFVRNRCSNGIIIPLASTHLSASPVAEVEKDISLDSLDGADTTSPRKESTGMAFVSPSSSSGTFSRSETFEKVLGQHAVPNITDDLADSTDSTCSDLNQLCNMSEYIEDHFLDQDHHPSEPTLPSKTSSRPLKPQKRLLVPGLLNRLIYLRRVLSDSDLRQKVCCIGENEMQFHVYHANTIHEHSIELNLAHTYGSESELHVWSHDCSEQRRVADERQQQLLLSAQDSHSKLSHIERMIRMTLDDHDDDESNLYQFNGTDYDQQLALERQTLLQQIYEYPWLLQEEDIDQAPIYSSPNSDQPLLSPSPDLVVPSHNPDFYQLCALTNSSSFAASFGTNSRHTTPPIASSVL